MGFDTCSGDKSMNNKSQTIDMINGPLIKNMFIFAIPLMLSSLMQMLFNSADTIIVGKFAGQEALAAVGATGSIIFFLTATFMGMSMGANVTIARMIGRGQLDKIRAAVHTSYFLAIAGGTIMIILGFLFSPFMLRLVETPANIIDRSLLYMRIFFSGSIFNMIYNFGSAVLRSQGDTKRPTMFLALSGVINVLLNLFFVVVLKISVAGVAIATVISQFVACSLVTRSLMLETGPTHLDLKEIRMDPQMAKDIISIGLPAGLQGMMFSLSNVVIQSGVNSFGSTVVAGNSAAANIENYVYIGTGAFTSACMTFTGQNAGAGRLDNIRKIMFTTFWLTVLSGMVIGFIGWYKGEFFLSLFTNSHEVIEAGMYRLQLVCLFLFLNGLLDVFVASMRGMGYSSFPTVMTLAGICGLRLIYLWTYFPAHKTLSALYFCFPLSWTVTSILQAGLWIILFRKYQRSLDKEIQAG